MQQVAAGIYVETKNRGSNTSFVVTTEGIVMIDSPLRPSDSAKWRDEIAKKGQVRYLINTEPHMDHVAGNYFFPGTGISQEETRKTIAHISVDEVRQSASRSDPQGLALLDKYQVKTPVITFSERLSLYMGGYTFHLMHLPGHTSGETAVHVPEARVLFTGDNICYKVQPFLHDSNPFQWLESLKKIQEMDIDKIVPGHGDVCDKSYIPEQASFIQEWLDTVKKAINQGLSREVAMEKISFLGRYPMDVGLDAMGPQVQRWNVARLYDLLKG